jgi:gas vesicle protein
MLNDLGIGSVQKRSSGSFTIMRRFTMSEQGNQVAKAAAFIAGGAVIGAGLGLLFAPQTGVETRRSIGRYARKAQVQTSRWGRAVKSGVEEVLDRKSAKAKSAEESRPQLTAVLN